MERDDKVEELDLKVQFSGNDSKRVSGLQAQVTRQDVLLTTMHMAASPSAKPLRAMTRNHALLRSKLNDMYTAGERREEVVPDFVRRV